MLNGKTVCGCMPLECSRNADESCSMKPLDKTVKDGHVHSANKYWYLPARGMSCKPSDSGCEYVECTPKENDNSLIGYIPGLRAWYNCVESSKAEKFDSLEREGDVQSRQAWINEQAEKGKPNVTEALRKEVALDVELEKSSPADALWRLQYRVSAPCVFDQSANCANKELLSQRSFFLARFFEPLNKAVGAAFNFAFGLLDACVDGGKTFLKGVIQAFKSAGQYINVKGTDHAVRSFYLSEGANLHCFQEQFPGYSVTFPRRFLAPLRGFWVKATDWLDWLMASTFLAGVIAGAALFGLSVSGHTLLSFSGVAALASQVLAFACKLLFWACSGSGVLMALFVALPAMIFFARHDLADNVSQQYLSERAFFGTYISSSFNGRANALSIFLEEQRSHTEESGAIEQEAEQDGSGDESEQVTEQDEEAP
eukprot:CAMPEP_0117616542 /NCGR_PEP_ID=MMETSP0784-20121206/85113_1 /TAXON_ID=39447 /ORGANISM="" /LENGTH=426 /DNA_ID=CAMNT_0005420321 /DNA_START=1 /DNA_END=1279 /DNA_ORIENTATION=+